MQSPTPLMTRRNPGVRARKTIPKKGGNRQEKKRFLRLPISDIKAVEDPNKIRCVRTPSYVHQIGFYPILFILYISGDIHATLTTDKENSLVYYFSCGGTSLKSRLSTAVISTHISIACNIITILEQNTTHDRPIGKIIIMIIPPGEYTIIPTDRSAIYTYAVATVCLPPGCATKSFMNIQPKASTKLFLFI